MAISKSSKVYGIGCIVILAVSLVAGRTSLAKRTIISEPKANRFVQPAFLPSLKLGVQQAAGRTEKRLHLKQVHSFQATLNALPARIIPSSRDTVLVLDQSDSTVKEYSESGELIHKYSSNLDSNPAKIIDFTLSGDGAIWTCDPNGDLLKIGADGSIQQRVHGLHAMRLLWFQERLVAMTVASPALPYGDRLFITVQPSGQILNRFGEIVADNSTVGAAVAGQISTQPESDVFVLAPSRAGFIAEFGTDGAIHFLIPTIQPLPLPAVEIKARGGVRLPPLPRGRPIDVAVANGLIFLLTKMPSGSKTAAPDVSVADVYNLQTGQYQYTFRLPEDCSAFAIRNNRLYAASGSTLYEWVSAEGWPR